MQFQDPWILLLIPVIVPVLFYHRRKGGTNAGFRFSSGELLTGLRSSLRLRLSRKLIFLRGTVVLLVVFALARPRSPLEESRIQTEGIDIVLAVDTSTSMLAEDFKLGGKRRNRLEAVKEVVRDFVAGRENDRIGMVAFAARAYTICPLTLDHAWLLQNLERVKIGMIEDGTAIGSGIMSAVNRLKDTEAKGKVVVLLTDGINNAGKIPPLTAAEAAAALKIKIYTIGAGTRGMAPYPVKDFFGNTVYRPMKIEIDEETLTQIAADTEARYFRATDTESLREIYREIDRLEKVPVEERGYSEYRELFPRFLIPGLALLFLEIILSNTVLRKIP